MCPPRPPRRSITAVLASLLFVAALPLAVASSAGARPVGGSTASGPLADVLAAAAAAVDARPPSNNCGLAGAAGRDRLAAMMLVVPYLEAGASSTVPPSPMTLGRADSVARRASNANLFAFGDPQTPYRRAYFHAGVGMWQFDTIGLGQPHAASYWINTATAAPSAAATMVSRWCTAWANPATYPSDSARRAYVWSPWAACAATKDNPPRFRCEEIHNEIFNGTTLVNLEPVASVTSTGGMVARRCQNLALGVVLDCYWVNPALAQGYLGSWTATPNGSTDPPHAPGTPTPLSLPFYSYEFNGKEYRHWLAADTGYPGDITAVRALNADARAGLAWTTGPALCDLTLTRGACTPDPPSGPARPVTATHPTIVGQGRGVGLVTYNANTVIADRRSDGSTRLSFLNPPFWSGWSHLAGVSTGDPDVAAWGTDHLEVFIRGADGAIWRNVLAGGGATGWGSLGGSFTSGPAAVSWAPGRVDVFARGLDGALWSAYLADGVFSGWYSLGGSIISDPEVASWGAGRLDVFATGVDRQLWHRAWNGQAFEAWEPLGGVLSASPAAASSAPGQIDIAVRGADGAVYVRQWTGTGYTGFASLGGSTSSAPELAATGPGTAILLVRGSDGNLYQRRRAANGAWTAFATVP